MMEKKTAPNQRLCSFRRSSCYFGYSPGSRALLTCISYFRPAASTYWQTCLLFIWLKVGLMLGNQLAGFFLKGQKALSRLSRPLSRSPRLLLSLSSILWTKLRVLLLVIKIITGTICNVAILIIHS